MVVARCVFDMTQLKETHNVVLEILKYDERARNDDMYLINQVYSRKIDTNLSFNNIVSNRKNYDLPSFATITRCRRKIQEAFPQLKAKEIVQELREEQYCEHKCYAMDIEYDR